MGLEILKYVFLVFLQCTSSTPWMGPPASPRPTPLRHSEPALAGTFITSESSTHFSQARLPQVP